MSGADYGYKLESDGLWFYPSPKDDNKPAADGIWLCAPIEVTALGVDDDDRWGKLLSWLDPDQNGVKWIMPSRLLGKKDELWQQLLDRGLNVTPSNSARDLLLAWLSKQQPEKRVRVTRRLGWFGDPSPNSYVLPERVVGTNGIDVFFDGAAGAYVVKGTLTEWQEHVGKLCRGNSRLIFAASIGFAAPLLYCLNEPSGGFHLVGLSQTGKSKTQRVLCSTTGVESRTWRATDNGLESVCEERCDSVLVLDEMGQVDPIHAGSIAYMVANGEGKSRATTSGDARKVKRWRNLLLSSGEITLADKLNEDGRKPRGGQEIRLVDIPADAGAGMGIFEDIHGAASPGEFAEMVGRASAEYVGAPFMAWLEQIVPAVIASPEVTDVFRHQRRQFITDNLPDGASGQVRSVCGRFGVVALAGEAATNLGITGWNDGEATAAAATCFRAWLAQRGTVGDHDIEQGIRQVVAFIGKHGGTRFETIRSGNGQFADFADHTVYNRVGYRKFVGNADNDSASGDWHYYALSAGWDEITKGYNPKQIAKVMASRGLVIRGSDSSKIMDKITAPDGTRPRVYHLCPDLVEYE